MTVSRACYCNREECQRSIDFADTQITNAQLDRAIEAAADTIDAELHRVFYPNDATLRFDWPNYQYAAPWRLWFDQWDLVSLTTLESPAGTVIPSADVFLRPLNRRPGWPCTYMELDRSTTAAWGAGATPQASIHVTGTWGFTADTTAAGILAAAISSTSATTCTVSDGSQMGPGDLIVVDSERMVVADKAMTDTAVAFSGPATASASDSVLAVPDGTKFAAGEVILLDAERMLITEITGNNLVLKRAWDGTQLAAHTSGTIWAARLLTVLRGQYGTAAATHLISAAVGRLKVPAKIRSLAVAEAVNQVLQETSGYARTVGGPDMASPAPGVALAELWDEAVTIYGRKARQRAI